MSKILELIGNISLIAAIAGLIIGVYLSIWIGFGAFIISIATMVKIDVDEDKEEN